MLVSIKSKLLGSHLLLVFLVALILGVILFRWVDTQLVAIQGQQLNFLARHGTDMLDGRFRTAGKLLQQVADANEVLEFQRTQNVLSLNTYLTRYSPPFERLTLINPSGWEAARVERGVLSPLLGQVADSSLITSSKAYPGKVVWGSPAQEDDRLYYPLALHLFDSRSGESAGTLVGALPRDYFTQVLKNFEIGKSGFLVLVNGREEIIFDSRVQDGVTSAAPALAAGLQGSLGDLSDLGTGGLKTVMLKQGKMLVASGPVGWSDWQLLALVPEAEYLQPKWRLRDLILGVAGMLLLVAALASYLLAEQFSRPILSLTRAADAMGDGNFNYPLKAWGSRELVTLGQSFVQLREELRKSTVSREYLEQIFSSMGEGLLLIGLDGRIRNGNRRAMTLLGYDEKDLIGQSLLALMDGVEEGAENWVDQLLSRPGERHSNKRLRRADGTPIAVDFSWTVLHDPSGSVQDVACIFRPRRASDD